MRAYLLGGRPLYFPFLSGILRYDCVGCDAPCCKGEALGIGKSRELVTILKAQPRAALFAVPGFRGSSLLSLQPPKDRCWFLDSKNTCRIENVIGREAKPSGCRMFPFQTVRSAGEAIVVLPDLLCPLTVQDAPSDAVSTSHDALALEMHQAQIPRTGHPELAAPRDLRWEEALPLERRILEESALHLNDTSYLRFAEVQLMLTGAALGVEVRPAQLARVEETMRRFLRVDERPSHGAVRDLVGLTGVLRMTASALPRRDLPGALVATSVLTAVYEGMRGVHRSARTVVSLFETQLPLLYALSHLGSRPTFREGMSLEKLLSPMPTVRDALRRVVVAIRENDTRGTAFTLEDVLRDEADAFATPLSPDAVTMLHGLGRVLLHGAIFVPV